MPKNADTHTQNNAPGPPLTSAVAQPVMLPVPTWAAMAVANAWKLLIPWSSAFLPRRVKLPKTRWTPSPKRRSCTPRSRMVKNTPVPTSRNNSSEFHRISLACSMAAVKIVMQNTPLLTSCLLYTYLCPLCADNVTTILCFLNKVKCIYIANIPEKKVVNSPEKVQN